MPRDRSTGLEYQLRLAVFVLLWVLRYLLDGLGQGMYPTLMMLALAALVLVYSLKIPRRGLQFGAIISALVLFGAVLAMVVHSDALSPFRGAIRYLSYFASFYIAFRWQLRFEHLANAFIGLVFLEILITIPQFGEYERPKGTLINSNHISYLLVMATTYFLICRNNWVMFSLLSVYAFILGGLGGSLSILIVFGVYVTFFGTKALRKVAIFLLPIVLVAGGFFLADRLQEQTGITQIAVHLENNRPGGAGSLVWRIVTWRNGIVDVVSSGYFLTGKGIEYTSKVSPYFPGYFTEETHNDYVRIFMEFGLIGLTLYVGLYLSAVHFFWGQSRRTKDPRLLFLTLTLVSLGAGQVVGNIVTQATLWWVFFGLLAPIYRSNRPLTLTLGETRHG